MKILFITSARGVDYQSDCLFHGLVKIDEEMPVEVTDTKYLWYLSQPLTPEQKAAQYGRGFTITGNLEDRSGINREGIADRIASHEFDLIVYGSIARCHDWIGLVETHYNKWEIAIVDGEDDAVIRAPYNSKGVYFKRELTEATRALPISFAMPGEKFLYDAIEQKKRVLAELIPGNLKTYRFTDEEEYYKHYAAAFFGLTMKKAGWDCLRHYEIIGSGCLPYFQGMEACPKSIMVHWPWRLQMKVNRLYADVEKDGRVCFGNYKTYSDLYHAFRNHALTHLTTRALAYRFLKEMGK